MQIMYYFELNFRKIYIYEQSRREMLVKEGQMQFEYK